MRDQPFRPKRNEKSGSIPDHFASQKIWLLTFNTMEMRDCQEMMRSKKDQTKRDKKLGEMGSNVVLL